ncbi:hypothetical protein AGDE_11581 [Angomonas deanei]|uniref:Zinc finger, ZZ type, putative n=1 Tax=Angomonas deanei TaxID=59799 RepID=A0A7G2C668_9TRYP|nr:hypothetical protein AGDE_11581 [Angomonas deanei]CAD2215290.1 Zinc finger, ZZ type, putative [Angomonas deanei]|eukprot:EPY26019.1 hypothetical protein AGDE_11581 [Angomonas deanei]
MSSNTEEAPATAYKWRTLVDYERGDIVLSLLKSMSSPLFKNDQLQLIGREKYSCFTGGIPSSDDSLLIHGYVSHQRKEALLWIVRNIRLRFLSDLNSDIRIGPVVTDEVPRCFLEPLTKSPSTEAYRRWYRCYYAMQCGLLHKIKEQREITKERLDVILKDSASSSKENYKATQDKRKEHILSGQTYRDYFSQLQSDEFIEADGRRYPPLSLYYSAAEEQRLDMNRVSATVPTVFIAWSYRYPECLEWMQRTVLRNTLVADIKKAMLNGEAEADPWMSFVSHYVAVPPRRKEKDRRSYLPTIPPNYKRAQIVFVNMDGDRSTGEQVFESILMRCGHWRSTEVSLMSMWAGGKGLQSEYATLMGVRTLPHVVATTPCKRNYLTFMLERPTVTYVTPQVASAPTNSDAGPDDKCWYAVDPTERSTVLRDVEEFIHSSSASVMFSAQIDTSFTIDNPYTDISTKALGLHHSSKVSLKGTLFFDDILRLKQSFSLLASLKDFSFVGQVIERSVPFEVRLKVQTPRGRIRGEESVVVCHHCLGSIRVEREPHFQCMQCSGSARTVCEACFEKQWHPGHHILLRLPPNLQSLTLPLLWGPSNLAPVPLFNNTPYLTQTQPHIGIICDRCFKPFKGMRWKCSMCHQYDLCPVCFSKRIKREKEPVANEGKRGHLDSHPFLCIPGARSTTFEELLRPKAICRSSADTLSQLNTRDVK